MIRGIEVIPGAGREGAFGHRVMFGLGGIYTEVLKDARFGLPPLSGAESRKFFLSGFIQICKDKSKFTSTDIFSPNVLVLNPLVRNALIPEGTDMDKWSVYWPMKSRQRKLKRQTRPVWR